MCFKCERSRHVIWQPFSSQDFGAKTLPVRKRRTCVDRRLDTNRAVLEEYAFWHQKPRAGSTFSSKPSGGKHIFDAKTELAKSAHAKVAFLLLFCSGSPKTMKILSPARCRSAYFPRMATIPLAHLMICNLQENSKSPPFSETTLFFIHLKRCTIEILGRQMHY